MSSPVNNQRPDPWYWLDQSVATWLLYSPEATAHLHQARNAGHPCTTLVVNGSTYLIDFGRMVQRNAVTLFERQIWCGSSPPQPASPAPATPAAAGGTRALALVPLPLSDDPRRHLATVSRCIAWGFPNATTQTPPCWQCGPSGGLVRLDPASDEARLVLQRWQLPAGNTLPLSCVTSICRVEHPQRWFAYHRKLEEMRKRIPDTDPEGGVKELHLFHGSNRDSVEEILKSNEGVDAGRCVRGMYGRGSYFALSNRTSAQFTQVDNVGERHILLCRVMVGRMLVGDCSMLNRPNDCDTTVSANLGIYCKYSNDEKYEEYVISYR